MKILFVDDMQERHTKAIQQNIGRIVTSAYTAKEAIRLMREQCFDVVCLDHDLADEHYLEVFEGKVPGATLAGSGTEIAAWMASKDFPQHNRPKQVILHSLNPAGRQRMLGLLRDAGFNVFEKPFTMW